MASSDELNPFHNRPDEWKLLSPLVGNSLLELGNKKNGDIIYKQYFESLGFRHISIDQNGLDGALRMDLTKPLNLGTFDMVTNIGTTEHVSEGDWNGQVRCWKNIMEAMHVGSVLVSLTPAPGAWQHHGVWYPKERFFHELARLNGLKVERVYIDDAVNWRAGMYHRENVMARLVRVEDKQFAMPDIEHMFKNIRHRGGPKYIPEDVMRAHQTND